MIGNRFGYLTVIADSESVRGNKRYLCRCDCGNEKIIYKYNLTSGGTKTCGCRMGHVIHGQTRKNKWSGAYVTWAAMIQRTSDENSIGWKFYGGRGIKVCDAWKTFSGFYSDMGDRPEGMSLDRINSNGDYEKSNCRWATVLEQARNRRGLKMDRLKVEMLRYLASRGVKRSELAALCGISVTHTAYIITRQCWA